MQGFKKFLKNLQHADNGTKRRWLFSMSGISIVIIVIIWIWYARIVFPALQRDQVSSSTISLQNENDSFGKIFMRGFSRIKDDAETQLDIFKKNLERVTQISSSSPSQ